MHPPVPWMELDRTENGLRDALAEALLVPVKGMLEVPSRERLGRN